MEDVSVLMRRGVDEVNSPDNEARQTVMILSMLDFVLVNVNSGRVVLRRQVRRCRYRQSELYDRLERLRTRSR